MKQIEFLVRTPNIVGIKLHSSVKKLWWKPSNRPIPLRSYILYRANWLELLSPLINSSLTRGIKVEIAYLRFSIQTCLLSADEAHTHAGLNYTIWWGLITNESTSLGIDRDQHFVLSESSLFAYRQWIAIDAPRNGQIMDIGTSSSIDKNATIPQPARALEISTEVESIRSTPKAGQEFATTLHAAARFINGDGRIVLPRVGQIRKIQENQWIAFLRECKTKERSMLSGGHFNMNPRLQ